MVAKRKEDVASSIISRIMSEPVPNAGQLKHPIQTNKRAKFQVTIDDLMVINARQKEIVLWTTRDFLDYFAKRYNEVTGGNYRKAIQSDCAVFQKMLKFMSSNGLAPQEYTKNLLDWGFEKVDYIRQKRGSFTPIDVLSVVNYYYQDEIMPRVETGAVVRTIGDTSLLDEINAVVAEKNGSKERQLFVDFGIPVVATHLVSVRGLTENAVNSGVQKLLESLVKGNLQDKEKLSKVLLNSIIGSPYPKDFILTDWREKYKNIVAPYIREDWYRSEDYGGKYLEKYNALLGEK